MNRPLKNTPPEDSDSAAGSSVRTDTLAIWAWDKAEHNRKSPIPVSTRTIHILDWKLLTRNTFD
ncbi:MAG: Uncharacterised protein [Flavobacteriia bacterium]|nr:MAG: Uncharacterised protein [Flavobacteriia bacterium]